MRDPTSIGGRIGGRGGRVLAVAVAGLLLVAATGCSKSNDTASSNDATTTAKSAADLLGPMNPAKGAPVRIGMVSDGQTQAYDNTDELRAGQAVVDWFNAHKGGIGGRPMELVTCQIGGDPGGAADCANQMIEKHVLAVALSQSAVAQSLWEPLHKAGVPLYLAAGFGDAMEKDTKSTFLTASPVATILGLPVATARDEHAKKIAFVVIDVPQAVDILSNAKATLEKAGLDYTVVRVPVGTADMTSQMQQVANSGAKVVHVIGNDAFCIAAFQGLKAVAYDGSITAITQCITDTTRKALPGGLKGINVVSTVALGATGDPTYETYRAVMSTYGKNVKDLNNFIAMGGYSTMASLLTAAQGVSGDVTTQSVTQAIKTMQESVIPGGGGTKYKCGGSADPTLPAVCTNQWLRTTLDANGQPTTYKVEDSSNIL
jgi:branched-chain amino acid transport system substrate-binding protein